MIGIDVDFQHLVLVALLILFYFLPAESIPTRNRRGED